MNKSPINFSIWIILGPVLLIAVVAVVLPLLKGVGERPPDESWNGVFYSNSDDPSLFVPKRYGIGYTLNFGNPWSWVVLALILIGAVLPLVLARTMIHSLK